MLVGWSVSPLVAYIVLKVVLQASGKGGGHCLHSGNTVVSNIITHPGHLFNAIIIIRTRKRGRNGEDEVEQKE